MPVFSKSDVVEQAWEIMKKNFWFLVGLAFVVMAISFIPSFFGKERQAEPFVLGIVAIIWIVQIFLSLGVINVSLKLTRGETASWADVWKPKHLFWRFLGGSILYGLIVGVGFVLLIAPGIFISIRLQFFTYALIDKDVGILEALRASWAITRGSWWNLFFFNILLTLIIFLGLMLLFVGMFAAIPVTWMAYALLYYKLAGQSSANIYNQESLTSPANIK